MEDLIIGRRLFTDGTTRPVYQDEGGQYVLDDHGEKVYGVWILTEEILDGGPYPDRVADLPIIIDAHGDKP